MGSRCLSSKNENNTNIQKLEKTDSKTVEENIKVLESIHHSDINVRALEISFFYFTIYKRNKSKILDPSIKSYITCPICEQNIDNVKILPRNLPCGHTLCNICIEDIKKKASIKYKCPFDRIEINMNQIIPISSFLLDINGFLSESKNDKTYLNTKIEMKVRNIAYSSMKTILFNRKYKIANIKKYLELIASEIKDKIKIIDNNENYLNFSIVIFLFQKDVKFISNGTCFNYFNDEIHCTELYVDDEWKCLTFIYVYNSKNLKLFIDQNCLDNNEIIKVQKQCIREIEKLLSGKTNEMINDDTQIALDLCEVIKNKVMKDMKANYSFSVDSLISNINAEEFGRFGGFFKKKEILRIPIKHKISDLNCLVNISCFKTV